MGYISDIIDEAYVYWEKDESIYISTPTGSGKTYFILTKLLPYAIERNTFIQYLVNRTILKKQLEEELLKIEIGYRARYGNEFSIKNHIRIDTYQALEEGILNNPKEYLCNCGEKSIFLVVDECHYFYNDATFNTKNYLSYLYVEKNFNMCRIFMSATMDRLPSFSHFNHRELVYGSEPEYSYVEFNYFEKNEELIELIKERGSKWLIFVNAKQDGNALEKKLKQADIAAVFVDAEYNNDERTREEIENIIEKKKTSCQVIIATSVLDNGISLVDDKLKHMVIMAETKEEFIQMLGRKRRLSDSEKLQVYVKKRNKQDFVRRKNEIKNIINFHRNQTGIEQMNSDYVLMQCMTNEYFYNLLKKTCFICNGYTWVWCKEPGRSAEAIYYSILSGVPQSQDYSVFQVHFNPLAISQYEYLFLYYNAIIERFDKEGEDAFLHIQAEWLGMSLEETEKKIQENKEELYKIYHAQVMEIIDSHFVENQVYCMETDEWGKFMKEIHSSLKELLKSKFDNKDKKDKKDKEDEKWKTISSAITKASTMSEEKFNLMLKMLELPYYRLSNEERKKRGIRETYAIEKLFGKTK